MSETPEAQESQTTGQQAGMFDDRVDVAPRISEAFERMAAASQRGLTR